MGKAKKSGAETKKSLKFSKGAEKINVLRSILGGGRGMKAAGFCLLVWNYRLAFVCKQLTAFNIPVGI